MPSSLTKTTSTSLSQILTRLESKIMINPTRIATAMILPIVLDIIAAALLVTKEILTSMEEAKILMSAKTRRAVVVSRNASTYLGVTNANAERVTKVMVGMMDLVV
ncbi:hypothetical protein CKAN_00291800 [Cinnamomum micranthum f. kanehirae]|uniref:Uncharacterized protein n=1 Tax=Cinnamomum micranthum f. kanehirae TaxID=337451 RepID=A0A443N7S2_9MAGN|nr:hypothetical protein CKAN_00291800 [Cinnamomum micranthum f. kanehirae]